MRSSRLLALVTASLATLGAPLSAHEFWISPERYQIAPGEAILAELRVGENLSGAGYPFIPSLAERHFILQNGKVIDPGSGLGDRPAIDTLLETPGLAILVHETADSSLTYSDWEKFRAFTEHKDFTWALEAHTARGLPETGFRESYRRYGKSLIAVGDGKGADTNIGLLTELVALRNPYTSPLPEGLPVQVFAYGAPRSDAQVELFARSPEGEVTVTQHRTDSDGKVTLPLVPGTEYLVDAVLLEERTANKEGDPVWHSLWASLSFRTPS
ncbi:MAG: DUF4198 domain-containing protein [Pseudomonadota bacterium]